MYSQALLKMKSNRIGISIPAFAFVLAASVAACGNGSAINDPEGYKLEEKVYVRVPASIIDMDSTSHVCGLVRRGDSLEVIGYDCLEKGRPYRYLVKKGKTEAFIYGKYVSDSLHKAVAPYLTHALDSIHRSVKDRFKGGKAISCDFQENLRPADIYKGMPDPCNAFYLNINPSNLKNIDAYIRLADSTRINAFVLDMKDNECPGFKAEAMRLYSPTNYRHAGSEKEALYKKVVEKLHRKGYWVIGRITCFKDSYFAKDHPESCISMKEDGKPFYHNKSYWPSAYSRKCWRFNVELAKECVRKFGIDEINFDYCRFPDRMTSIDGQLNFHNTYGESKVEAIQNFVRYAADELHAIGVPLSVDVFGESAQKGYTTAYGQYWPALSNVADVICAMPYPDHFASGSFGLSKPWNHPYELMKAWGERAAARQRETTSPARVRTWIQVYHIMRHVDPDGIDNNSDFVRRQIQGLYDAGLTDGYLTWNAGGAISIYRKQASAYSIDFSKKK